MRRTYLAFGEGPRRKADVKYRYVAHFLNRTRLAPDGEQFARNHENANDVIKAVDKEIDEENSQQRDPKKLIIKPKRSNSSLLRWVSRALTMQIQQASLLHLNAVLPHPKQLPQTVFDIIASEIRKMVKLSPKLGPTKILLRVKEEIGNYNRKNGTNLPTPGLTTVQSEYRRYDAWIRLASEKGTDAADLEFGAIGKLERSRRILDTVEVDHHKFDLHGIFGKTPLGKAMSDCGMDRFWVCLALDVHSGYPVGFAISFNPGGLLPALMCIEHAIGLKPYVKTRWPDIDGELLGFGKPVRFRYDNAKEFVSLQLQNVLSRIGVGFQLAIPGKPQSKPYVERGFGTIEQEFVHWLKGTTFSNIREKGDRNPVQEAVVPWDDFQKLFHQYLIEVFARRQQRDLDYETPEERWMRGAQNPAHRPRPLTKYEQERLDIVTTIEVDVKAKREGFVWRQLWFNSNELQDIRRRSGCTGKRKKNATPLKARIPLLDLSKAYVADPTRQDPDRTDAPTEIVVPCKNPHVRERTIWQHDVVCKYLLNKKNGSRRRSPYNLKDYEWGFLKLFRNTLSVMGVSYVDEPPKKGRLSGGQGPRFAGAFHAGPGEHALKRTEDIIERYDMFGEIDRAIKANAKKADEAEKQKAETKEAERDAPLTEWPVDPIIMANKSDPDEADELAAVDKEDSDAE